MTTDLRNQFDQRTPEIMSDHLVNLRNKVKEPQKLTRSEDSKICEPQAVRFHPKPKANEILGHCSPKVNFLRLDFQPNTLRTNTSLSGGGAAKNLHYQEVTTSSDVRGTVAFDNDCRRYTTLLKKTTSVQFSMNALKILLIT